MTVFEQAFERTVGHEGGYVDDKNDPGGETRYGISKRSYPNEDIPNLTLGRAREIYERDFWVQAGCHLYPSKLAIEVFDASVHHGPSRAVRLLQEALGLPETGAAGAPIVAAINDQASLEGLLARFLGFRLAFMADLSNWQYHGKGWARRVATILKGIQ